jgi:hypothetical protein
LIGYRVSLTQLKQLVTAESANWIARARARTRGFVAAGRYRESSTIWSEVKVVYMRLQGEAKCVYCERKLEGEERGKAEHDVEHFRPKSSVRTWKAPAALAQQGVRITAPGAAAPGYHRLPYHLFNYSAACKPCNSALKSDCFPIAGTYKFGLGNPKTLGSEKPFPQLEVLASGMGATTAARQIVNGFSSAKSAHANCARSFVALHGRDRAEAQALFERAAAFIEATS